MPSSAMRARAIAVSAVALLLSGPLVSASPSSAAAAAPSRPAAAAGASGPTGEPAASGDADASGATDVDPARGSAADVIAALRALARTADERQQDYTDALAARVEAEAAFVRIEAAAPVPSPAREPAAADGGGDDEAAVDDATPVRVDPPTTDLFEMLGAAPAPSPAAHEPEPESEPEPEPEPAPVEQAADARGAAEGAAHDLRAAETQLVDLVEAVEARQVSQLHVANGFAVSDARRAAAVRGEAASIAAELQAATAGQAARVAARTAHDRGPGAAPAPASAPVPPPPPPLPDPAGSASGALTAVGCANGDRIVVDASIGAKVEALVAAARAAGVGLCGGGFRTAAEQIELRRAHCGTSEYAVHRAPPAACSPPTARPGTSNHEDGLAIDVSCGDGHPMTHASPCYRWLAGNAARYSLHNLPSEPWHWSVTGR